MASKRFKLIIIGLFLAVLIYVGTAILNNFIENKLLASLIVYAVIGAYPLISFLRWLFSYEAREARLRQKPIENTLRWALANSPSEYKYLKDRYFNADRHGTPESSASSSNIEKNTDVDNRVERAYKRFYDALSGLPSDSKGTGRSLRILPRGRPRRRALICLFWLRRLTIPPSLRRRCPRPSGGTAFRRVCSAWRSRIQNGECDFMNGCGRVRSACNLNAEAA